MWQVLRASVVVKGSIDVLFVILILRVCRSWGHENKSQYASRFPESFCSKSQTHHAVDGQEVLVCTCRLFVPLSIVKSCPS